MNKLPPIEHDADMNRFYIPVNSLYEIQTKGKGSSYRICNIETHERNIINDAMGYTHEMITDMAKTSHAEMTQLQSKVEELESEIVSLKSQLEDIRLEALEKDLLD